MDLQVYYQKIREIGGKIAEEFPLVVSVETHGRGKGRDEDRSAAAAGGQDRGRRAGAAGDTRKS